MSDPSADRALIAAIAEEARAVGASRVASLFESDVERLLSVMSEARETASKQRKSSPFVYVMQ